MENITRYRSQLDCMDTHGGFPLFRQSRLSEEIKKRHEKAVNELDNEDGKYLIDTDKEEYIDYLVQEYWFDQLEINTEEYMVSTAHRDKDDAEVVFPVAGNEDLLKYMPRSYGSV